MFFSGYKCLQIVYTIKPCISEIIYYFLKIYKYAYVLFLHYKNGPLMTTNRSQFFPHNPISLNVERKILKIIIFDSANFKLWPLARGGSMYEAIFGTTPQVKQYTYLKKEAKHLLSFLKSNQCHLRYSKLYRKLSVINMIGIYK